MSVTKKVKKNVTNNVTNLWAEALRDAEQELAKAQRVVASWKGTIQTCRKRMKGNAPWPSMAHSGGQNSNQQHSV
jgi:hypothetical protein